MRRYLPSENRVVSASRSDINVPDPRLLLLHAARAKVLDLCGAAGYVEWLQCEAEEVRLYVTLKADGSSNLYALFCARGFGIPVG